MKKVYTRNIIPALMLIFGMCACADDLNISPENPQVNTDFIQDEVFAKLYATLALTGQEGPSGSGDVSGIDEGFSAFYRLTFTLNEYPTDELHCCWNDAGIPELNSIKWSSSGDNIEGLYGRLMYDVTLCNHFLEQTEGQTDDTSLRQRAEARFIRALNYYYLMDIYANVSFTETVSNEKPEQIKRADLFRYIESELIDIETDMYEPRQAPFGRADKAAAWLLLARTYLNAQVYTGTPRWGDAITYANKVIDSGYELANNYEELFMADNDVNANARKEIILPIRQDGKNIRSYGGSQYLIAATRANNMPPWGTTAQWGGLRARKSLVKKFFPTTDPPLNLNAPAMKAAAGDDRALFYSGGNQYTDGDGNTFTDERTLEITTTTVFKEGFSVVKWTNLRSDGNSTSDTEFADTDIPLLRMAEAYLIYAEATLRNGGTVNDALQYGINPLRARANATTLHALTLDNVLDERARELYFEGHRRTDLVRYGYFTPGNYLWDWKGGTPEGTGVSSKYDVYPIPASELNSNKNLTQNPGY